LGQGSAVSMISVIGTLILLSPLLYSRMRRHARA
jgi:hypothetical protein